MGQGETATLKGHAAERRAPSKEISKATRKKQRKDSDPETKEENV